MSEAAHTPGPWYGGTADSPWYVRRESDDACIAHMEDGGHVDPDFILIGDDERKANAKLIAAAPDLLTALEDMLEMGRLHIDGRVHPKGEMQVVESARAAIDKARS